MGHPRFSGEEIARQGEEIYTQSLRDIVETEEKLGKIIVIDIETSHYEIDDDALTASKRALARHPGAAIYAIRIGYDFVYTFSGSGPQRVKR